MPGLSREPDPGVGLVFAALADPTRRHLIRALCDGGEASPTALAGDLPISRQAVVKHLAALQAAGLVEPRRAGRENRYALTPAPLADAARWLAETGAEWDDRLGRLRRLLG